MSLSDYKVILDISEWQSPGDLDSLLISFPEIIGVYVKASQDVVYRNVSLAAYGRIVKAREKLLGYYDYLGNSQTKDQWKLFSETIKSPIVPTPTLIPMLDCEGAYEKYKIGVDNWRRDNGGRIIVYSDMSDAYHYLGEDNRWIAGYDVPPKQNVVELNEGTILSMKNAGYKLWQFTDNYKNRGIDASVVLCYINELKI